MNNLTLIQEAMSNKAKAQENWKHEAIEIAVDALLGATHREKEQHLKTLLAHLKNMPVIHDSELDLLPF